MSVRLPAGRTSPVRGSCNRGGVRPGARYQPRASACSHAARNRKGTTGMAPVVTMRQLLESGVHFGHQTRRWNPKMKRFILAERNGIYIIDLQQSLDFIDNAYEFIKETVAHGGTVLYVGTKKQAQEAVAEQARRVGMPFVNQRWLGGMLTNFTTVFKRLQRLKELEEIDFDDVAGSGMTKKELLHLRRERDKLERSLGGIRDMSRVPSALWVVDTKKEHIAVSEARKLGIPVIAILDTNCDPDEVTYPIPGNDDAIRSVALLTRVVADAVADGLIARAGAADGEEKPSTPAPGDIGAAEPLAEWERELLQSKATDDQAAAATAEAAAGAAEAAPASAAAAPSGDTEAPEAANRTAVCGPPRRGPRGAPRRPRRRLPLPHHRAILKPRRRPAPRTRMPRTRLPLARLPLARMPLTRVRLARVRLTLPRQRPSQRQSHPEPAAGPSSPGRTGPDTRAAAGEDGEKQPSGPPDHQTVRDEDMANVTAAEVKRLREHTAAGMMDCKRALEEADGDFDAAVEILRLKGAKDVSKRAARTASSE